MSGTELRDRGIKLVDSHTDSAWRDAVDEVIRAMAESGGEFTAEDVRVWVGAPPHPNAMGARFMAARKAGLLELVGYRKALRAEAHARALAVYRGAAK